MSPVPATVLANPTNPVLAAIDLGEANPEIRYGTIATPFGAALLGFTSRGLGLLHFLETEPSGLSSELAPELTSEFTATCEAVLRSRWPQGKFTPDLAMMQTWSDRLFPAQSTTQSAPLEPYTLDVAGTPFQRRVWQALLTIPFGQVVTYQDMAAAIGQPQATRAVGTAIGRNPVGYVIPCHRVVRASGELGGYRWGRDRKAAILAWEAAQVRHNPGG